MSEGRKELEEGPEQDRTSLEQKSWKFSYEALTHVHSLRLFLFNSLISAPLRCKSLRASLAPTSPFSSSPVVVCRWTKPEGDSYVVYVPVPFCLIDHSVPFAAAARNDHIEVKIKLVPFDGSLSDDLSFLGFTRTEEPMDRDGVVNSESLKPNKTTFSLTSDTEMLTAKRDVSFYCRYCSANLTSRSISHFQALPSADWRDLADHWFGLCCCPNGGHTKSMMTRFEQLLTPMRGVCLVGSTTCVTHCDDLVGSVIDYNRHVRLDDKIPVTEIGEIGDRKRQDDDAVMSCGTGDVKLPFSMDMQSGVDDLKLLDNPAVSMNGSCKEAMEESLGLACCGNGCDSGHGNIAHGGNGVDNSVDHVVKVKTPANGFMSGPSAFSSSLNWTPFNCHTCSNLIGVSTGEKEEGVQLFKCHISSDSYLGGPLDVFRYHTLERVFSNELLSSSEENSSYRYIIHDLKSKLPMLQLVLINHESLHCSGTCLAEQSFHADLGTTGSNIGQAVSVFMGNEYDADCIVSSQESEPAIGRGNDKFRPVFLEPVIKVMFRDASLFNCEQLRDVEKWAQEQQPDDIYMLESEVKSLAKSLHTNKRLLPDSCATFQQFHFSFLAR